MTYTDSKWADRLNYLAALEPGWYDGEGESINAEVLNKANTILHSLDSASFNVPAMFPLLAEDTGEGGISMEWAEKHQPHHLNLHISNQFAYEVYVLNLTTRETLLLETTSQEEAVSLLRKHLIRVGFASTQQDGTSEGLQK